MQRIAYTSPGYIKFFSKDSCEMDRMRYDDVWKKEKYKWSGTIDTLSIYRIKDTFTVKVIKLTNSELYFIIPKS